MLASSSRVQVAKTLGDTAVKKHLLRREILAARLAAVV